MIDCLRVESAIRGYAAVQDCAVRVRHSEDGVPRIVAYVQARGPWALESIAEHLRHRLPESLCPSAWVQVARMPLTAEGIPDDDVLFGLPVIDEEVLRRCEELAQNKVPSAQVRAVVEDKVPHKKPLHLSSLLPDWKRERSEGPELPQGFSDGEPLAAPGRMAYRSGGPLHMPPKPRSLAEAFLETASTRPEKGVLCINALGNERRETYGDLLVRSKRILQGLRNQGMSAGDSVLFQVRDLSDHLAAFWACILGGIRPAIVAVAPVSQKPTALLMKLYNTWQLLGSPPILANSSMQEEIRSVASVVGAPGFTVLAVEELEQSEEVAGIHTPNPDDIVFYQLTSGSTGTAKCIQETHNGILHHVYGSAEFNRYRESDVVLNWLPMDHVVPTLTVHLKDVCLSCDEIQVRTEAILAEPLFWLELIERHRVTHTWAPNFGFKLISEALSSDSQAHFDLSSVKQFMNAGEQVTLAVVREFLRCVGRFGVPEHAMQPAFGMAEACTCMTYQNCFSGDSGAHWVHKSSLGGPLSRGEPERSDAISFIDLGPPIPGVEIRITDRENVVVPEGVIGRLQIRGAVITPGYLHNKPANDEAFVGDGWFNSGDLGFILNGHLTVTGREKETIIIRGANFYCYEIEDLVNRLPGVEATYSAACAVDDGSGNDGLAVFFVPRSSLAEETSVAVRAIRSKTGSELGVTPACVVPLRKDEFPKTTSGKIQRSQLKKLLAGGRYDERLAALDIELANANTIPDWFFKTAWRCMQITGRDPQMTPRAVLLFDDLSEIARQLRSALLSRGDTVIRVVSGCEYRRSSPHEYIINPASANDYRLLLRSLIAEALEPEVIAHLWTCPPAPQADFDVREDILEIGVYSLVSLVQGLAAEGRSDRQKRIIAISTQAQAVRESDLVVGEKAMTAGLAQTINQEFPSLVCRHVDVQPTDSEAAHYVLDEMDTGDKEAEVAYRDGRRWVRRLERAGLDQAPMGALPFKPGAVYLISGGAGGIASELASYLVKNFRIRVLALGRQPRDERAFPSFLRGRPDHFRYIAVDVSSFEALRKTVEESTRDWDGQIAGVFHLAAEYHERALIDEIPQSMASIFRPKLYGAAALHRLLQEDGIFVHFSSVTQLFGGAMIGAYSMANRFLEAFSRRQRLQGKIRSYCFDWSTWENVGLSSQYPAMDVLRARGYEAISVSRGIQSLLAGLSRPPGQMAIGLDDRKPFIRQYCDSQPLPFRQVSALVKAAAGVPCTIAVPETIETRDAFGSRVVCEVRADGAKELTTEFSAPLNDTERRLLLLWKDVLQSDSIKVTDNFFEAGGNSLLLVQMEARLRRQFGRVINAVELFRHPTVAGLAEYLDNLDGSPEMAALTTARQRASARNARLRKLRDASLREIETGATGDSYGQTD